MSSGSRFTLSDGWWLAWIGAVWLIAVVIVPAFFQYGPRLERRLNSVTSQMEMVSVLPSGNGSLVMAKWTKYRNCEFRDMVWMRVGDDGILKEVTVITRPPGGGSGARFRSARKRMPSHGTSISRLTRSARIRS